jgi:hypothetical protein
MFGYQLQEEVCYMEFICLVIGRLQEITARIASALIKYLFIYLYLFMYLFIYYFSLRWYMRVKSHGDDNAAWRKLLTRPTELCGSPTSRDIWELVGEMVEGVRIFTYQYLSYVKVSLTRRKILRHGTSRFTSHPKEGLLRIFIALKN